MSAIRALPARPNLEFEHKEAKALLRRLRDGDAEALARARARRDDIEAGTVQLADAQLVIAREYGFESWPKLVHYFEASARQQLAPIKRRVTRDECDRGVRQLLAQHRDRRPWVASALGAYVPRLYGMPAEAVFTEVVTEDDAKLVVARMRGAPSWEVLLQGAVADGPQFRSGSEAPKPPPPPATDEERQAALNRQLIGPHFKPPRTATVRELLERGADPAHVPANGIPVLEHALLLWRDGEAVDLIAARVKPRRALWIAAGLGHVDGVRSFLDPQGRPTAEARRLRPDFDAVGMPGMGLPHPEPSDDDLLLEAFAIAMSNGRVAVLEYLLSRGFPVNTPTWGTPALTVAIGTGMPPVVEALVRAGADLDLSGWGQSSTPREIARELFLQAPDDPARRRIAELCGHDPDAILAQLKANPVPPAITPEIQQALKIAGDDAARLGQKEIGPENLLVGLIRRGGPPAYYLAEMRGRVDGDRLKAELGPRLLPATDLVPRDELKLDAAAQEVVQAAIAAATERHREEVWEHHLLHALTRPSQEGIVALLTRCGGDAAQVHATLTAQGI